MQRGRGPSQPCPRCRNDRADRAAHRHLGRRLRLDCQPVATSSRGYARHRECTYNASRFIAAAGIADPSDAAPCRFGSWSSPDYPSSQVVCIEGGWSADRELYNVVRGKAISGASTTPFLYGSDSNVLERLT
jgi:hypothetical protein